MPYLDFFGGKRLDILFGEEFEEGSQDNGVIALRILLEGIPVLSLAAIEGETVGPKDIKSDVFWSLDIHLADELSEASAIAIDSTSGPIHFNFEMFEELFGVCFEGRSWFLEMHNDERYVFRDF